MQGNEHKRIMQYADHTHTNQRATSTKTRFFFVRPRNLAQRFRSEISRMFKTWCRLDAFV